MRELLSRISAPKEYFKILDIEIQIELM